MKGSRPRRCLADIGLNHVTASVIDFLPRSRSSIDPFFLSLAMVPEPANIKSSVATSKLIWGNCRDGAAGPSQWRRPRRRYAHPHHHGAPQRGRSRRYRSKAATASCRWATLRYRRSRNVNRHDNVDLLSITPSTPPFLPKNFHTSRTSPQSRRKRRR